MAMSIARASAYTLVRQSDDEFSSPSHSSAPTAPPRSISIRTISTLAGLGALAAFYLFVTAKSAVASVGGKRQFSQLGRYEKLALTSKSETLEKQNAELKAQIDEIRKKLDKALDSPGSSDDAKAMAVAKERAAAVPQQPAGSSSPATAAAPSLHAKQTDFKLTKELIRSRCNVHNIILVTFVNSKRADYGYTWAGHVKRLNLTNYLVGAMDAEALTKLSARMIPTFDMESGLTTADYGYATSRLLHTCTPSCTPAHLLHTLVPMPSLAFARRQMGHQELSSAWPSQDRAHHRLAAGGR